MDMPFQNLFILGFVHTFTMEMTTLEFNFHPGCLWPSGIMSVFMENSAYKKKRDTLTGGGFTPSLPPIHSADFPGRVSAKIH